MSKAWSFVKEKLYPFFALVVVVFALYDCSRDKAQQRQVEQQEMLRNDRIDRFLERHEVLQMKQLVAACAQVQDDKSN